MPKIFAYNNNFYSFAAFKALPAPVLAPLSSTSALYMQMNLGNYGLDEKAFEYAMNGYNYLKSKKILLNKNVISIIDFTKPSTQKRLFVLDLKTNKILYNYQKKFPLLGHYKVTLQQAMRETELSGIIDAGIRIEQID